MHPPMPKLWTEQRGYRKDAFLRLACDLSAPSARSSARRRLAGSLGHVRQRCQVSVPRWPPHAAVRASGRTVALVDHHPRKELQAGSRPQLCNEDNDQARAVTLTPFNGAIHS